MVEESQQARSVRFLLTAGGMSAVATLLFMGLLRLAGFVHRKLLSQLPKRIRRHHDVLKVGETPLLDTSNLFPLIRRLLALVYWTVVLLLTYEWLTFVLQRFPYTRPWGESLDHYLLNLLRYVLDAIVSAIPGLVIALMIFLSRAESAPSASACWNDCRGPGPSPGSIMKPCSRLRA